MSLWVASVGYQGFQSADEFADRVAAAGVERVIDVRELPVSRKRGFGRRLLSLRLAESGIDYVHMGELGNPYREVWRAGRIEEGRALYRHHLAASAAAA